MLFFIIIYSLGLIITIRYDTNVISSSDYCKYLCHVSPTRRSEIRVCNFFSSDKRYVNQLSRESQIQYYSFFCRTSSLNCTIISSFKNYLCFYFFLFDLTATILFLVKKVHTCTRHSKNICVNLPCTFLAFLLVKTRKHVTSLIYVRLPVGPTHIHTSNPK